MKSYIALFAALAILFSAPVSAAEKIKVKLSPNEAAVLRTALSSLKDYTKIVHDARGQEVAVTIINNFGDAQLTIAHDYRVTGVLLEDYRNAIAGLGQADAAKLADVGQEVEVLQFSFDELKISGSPISIETLAQLALICKGCTAD